MRGQWNNSSKPNNLKQIACGAMFSYSPTQWNNSSRAIVSNRPMSMKKQSQYMRFPSQSVLTTRTRWMVSAFLTMYMPPANTPCAGVNIDCDMNRSALINSSCKEQKTYVIRFNDFCNRFMISIFFFDLPHFLSVPPTLHLVKRRVWLWCSSNFHAMAIAIDCKPIRDQHLFPHHPNWTPTMIPNSSVIECNYLMQIFANNYPCSTIKNNRKKEIIKVMVICSNWQ